MSIQEIESAIKQLPPTEVAQLAEWFAEYHADLWDRQIEADSASGKLDDLLRKVNDDIDTGRFTSL